MPALENHLWHEKSLIKKLLYHTSTIKQLEKKPVICWIYAIRRNVRIVPYYQQQKVVLFSRPVFQLELGSTGWGFLVIDPYISASCKLFAKYFLMIFFFNPFSSRKIMLLKIFTEIFRFLQFLKLFHIHLDHNKSQIEQCKTLKVNFFGTIVEPYTSSHITCSVFYQHNRSLLQIWGHYLDAFKDRCTTFTLVNALPLRKTSCSCSDPKTLVHFSRHWELS